MTFKDLFSHSELLQAIEEAGYTNPTQIQKEAIPEVIKGSDIQACAETGTGKSAAFLLPALLKVANPSEIKAIGPRILILVPTRELAMQVAAEAVKYSKHMPMVKTVCIYGGQPFPLQNKQLSRHYEILVATPGRLIDHMERGRIDFSRLEMLVLDEADRMLDMGFIEDVMHISDSTPPERQTLMFSATLKPSVLKLSKKLLKNPLEIRVAPQIDKQKHLISQKLHFVQNITQKFSLLEELLQDESINQVIVFTATKRHADELSDQLRENGHRADALHGDMKQPHRTRTINKLRQGKIRILVATDVAARGIDVPAISHVVNFDLPNNPEDYVHRIGRTGRAGAKGLAISFVSPKDRSMVREIERFTGNKLLPEEEKKNEAAQSSRSLKERRREKSFSDERRPKSRERKRDSFFEKKSQPSREKKFRKEWNPEFREERSQPKFRKERNSEFKEERSQPKFRKEWNSEEREENSQPKFRRERNSEFKEKKSASDRFQPKFSREKKAPFFKREETSEKDTGYFARREKKSSRGFIKYRDGDFQGSNIHREKAKSSAGHRGKNSTFSRKRRSTMHGQNVVQRKNVPFLPPES